MYVCMYLPLSMYMLVRLNHILWRLLAPPDYEGKLHKANI